ncbi:MAG: hypothetical protein R2824_24285 [Saprospiraceae bacterium]|nr:hypothetical protein [Lewinella sp.]
MRIIIGILVLIGLFSCKEDQPNTVFIENEELTSEQIDSILTEFKFYYETPIVIDSTHQVLIPISTQLLQKRTVYSKDGYDADDYPRYWNVLFYNRKTGATRLLTEDKIRISEINVNKNEPYDEGNRIISGKILYQIGIDDYNQDKKLNNQDPEYLFSSETDGEGLTRISPPNEDLQYFEVIPGTKQILMRTRRDVNGDLLFDSKDETILYRAELIDQEWKVTSIINPATQKSIENLYFEQWLRER